MLVERRTRRVAVRLGVLARRSSSGIGGRTKPQPWVGQNEYPALGLLGAHQLSSLYDVAYDLMVTALNPHSKYGAYYTPPMGPVQHTAARGVTTGSSRVHSRGYCGT